MIRYREGMDSAERYRRGRRAMRTGRLALPASVREDAGWQAEHELALRRLSTARRALLWLGVMGTGWGGLGVLPPLLAKLAELLGETTPGSLEPRYVWIAVGSAMVQITVAMVLAMAVLRTGQIIELGGSGLRRWVAAGTGAAAASGVLAALCTPFIAEWMLPPPSVNSPEMLALIAIGCVYALPSLSAAAVAGLLMIRHGRLLDEIDGRILARAPLEEDR